MIQISQLKVNSTGKTKDLTPYIAKTLRLSEDKIAAYQILKKSIDARKKPEIYYVYSVAVTLTVDENKVLSHFKKNNNIAQYQPITYRINKISNSELSAPRPVIIGAGPAGLFCAYSLAKSGLRPIILERGKDVESRTKDVNIFWEQGILNSDSNVQFGEGGAGTFSDGKLNTLVKDKTGRNQFVLQTFVDFGAPEQILWDAKPHIGTDILVTVIRNMRNEICNLGGEFHFQTKFTDFSLKNGLLQEIYANEKVFETNTCVLAIGHSARDTFEMLYHKQFAMSSKEFAVGFRIEHPQEMINYSQYGTTDIGDLPVAPYKLATKLDNERGVYSFCMCPGGHVVNAASQPNQLVVNGMSYSKRDSANANSAIVVSVGSKEYDLNDPMGAIAYQVQLEKKAYALANGKIPQQLYQDFISGTKSSCYGDFESVTKGSAAFADLNPLLSSEMKTSFMQGMEIFSHKIKGFDRADAILSGIESRTSSPVRIHRNEHFESNICGFYPCGEGAGYAGGIMSAAMDGLKVAESIIKKNMVNYE